MSNRDANQIVRTNHAFIPRIIAILAFAVSAPSWQAQTPATPRAKSAATRKPAVEPPQTASARPKLVVLLVVDQMRADYVDKFLPQWTGGLRRLVDEGAWFRDAAFPYAATETCVVHATISTGALPASHAMVSNEWFDRELQRTVTCTSDSNMKTLSYA